MIKILADSTCDLSKELIETYEVDILPLHIVMNDVEHRDGKSITPEELFAWSDQYETTPKTSAPGIEETIEFLRPHLEQGKECIVFCISEQMSTTGNVIRMAAQELECEERVHVIDSQSLSTGIGLLIIEAAQMAEKGMSATEIVAEVKNLREKVRASFVVDTLVYLHRGGRCGGLAAMLGGALKLHPKIVVENGAMHSAKKYRGMMKSVVLSYVKDMEEELLQAKTERVFITHSGCDESVVNAVRDYLESLSCFDAIHETRAGGVISSHCGPGTLGVLFIME